MPESGKLSEMVPDGVSSIKTPSNSIKCTYQAPQAQEIKGPPDKIKQVELNNIENAKELGLLIIQGNIETVPINILIDPGATDNFIHPRL